MSVRRGLRIAINHEANRVHWESKPIGQIVLIESQRLDEAWKRHSWPHIGPGGTGQNDGRYDRFGNFFFAKILKGTALEDYGPQPTVVFVNGRHRTAWLRDHGLNPLPISVDPKQVKFWKHFMGAKVLPWGSDLWWTTKAQ
jgi:hypothetical protein